MTTEWVTCGCGRRFQRPRGETYASCLGCQTSMCLAIAGVGPADPALAKIRGWNAAVSTDQWKAGAA